MAEDQYTLELKTRGLNEEEQEELLDRIEEEFGVEFEEDSQVEELHDPATIVGFYAAAVGTLNLLLKLYDWATENEEPVEVGVKHYGEGDIYVIDADKANQVEASVMAREGELVATELTYEDIKELRRIEEKSEE